MMVLRYFRGLIGDSTSQGRIQDYLLKPAAMNLHPDRQRVVEQVDSSLEPYPAVVWSYAKLSHKHEALFAAAAEHATRTIHTFQPQSMVSNITCRC